MSKVAIVLSGDQVVFTHVVPDNAHVILVPLGTPVEPLATPAPVTTLPQFLEDSPPESVLPKGAPDPNSRGSYGWQNWEIELAKRVEVTDEEVARRTGRTKMAVANYRIRKLGVKVGRTRNAWTEDEDDKLIEVIGYEILPTGRDYYAYTQHFPRHQAASSLQKRHQTVINRLNRSN